MDSPDLPLAAPTDKPAPPNTEINRVRQIVLDHDRYIHDHRDEMAEVCAIYETRWWEYVQGQQKDYKSDGTDIEVNRLHKSARAYLGALYPRSPRVVCEPDPRDRGSAQVTQAALNDWWKKPYAYLTVDQASMMAYTLPGAGLKVGYDPGTGNPITRTWMRAIPPWELVLDRDAGSYEDERFRGHVYQAPIEDVIARYPQLAGRIKGGVRRDFFDTAAPGNPPMPTADPATVGEYVRVFELLNLRAPYIGSSGENYRGRLEVYILDQNADVSGAPVVTTPLPFQDADGEDIPNIEPLIFDHQIGFPLRPIPPSRAMIPQQVELNRLRTAMAQDIRRDARKYVYREGSFEQDPLAKLNNGVDLQGVGIKDGTPIDQVIKFLENPPVSRNILHYTQQVEMDLDRGSAPSMNAQGLETDVTAFETKVIQQSAEQDVRYHMLRLYGTLERVTRLVQCAIRQAGKDAGDSEGSVDPTADPTAAPAKKKPVTKAFAPFTLKDGEEKLTVTDEALSGNNPITFVDSDNTPVNRQTMLEFMTGQGLVSYQGLWALVEKRGYAGLLAELAMQHIAESMNLPKDMHPGAMKAAMKKQEKPVVKGPPPGIARAISGPAAPPPPAAAAPASPADTLVDTLTAALTALGQIASTSPELRETLTPAAQVINTAIAAAKGSDDAAVVAALQQAVQALPDGLADEVKQVLAALLDALAGAAEPAPEAVAEPEAEAELQADSPHVDEPTV